VLLAGLIMIALGVGDVILAAALGRNPARADAARILRWAGLVAIAVGVLVAVVGAAG
jgi:hypothetical protein